MKLKVATILVTALLVFTLADFCQAGLGISPSLWIEKHALRGSSIEKVFTLSRAEPKENLYFKAEIEGEIKDWIKIDKGLEFTMPKGEQQFPIKVTIGVPQDAEYRGYQGSIRLKSESKTENVEGIGISLQALIQIELTVSKEEILDYEILQIAIPQQEEKESLSVVLKIWNRGNVEARPTKLTVNFWDKYGKEQLESKKITDFSGIEAIKPFSEGEIKIEIPIEFEPEQCWAKVKVYQDEELLKSEDIFFEIVEVGGLEKQVLEEKVAEKGTPGPKAGKINFRYILIGTGIVILIAGLGFGIKQLKKSKPTERKKKEIKRT